MPTTGAATAYATGFDTNAGAGAASMLEATISAAMRAVTRDMNVTSRRILTCVSRSDSTCSFT
jgi:hypothetical protein